MNTKNDWEELIKENAELLPITRLSSPKTQVMSHIFLNEGDLFISTHQESVIQELYLFKRLMSFLRFRKSPSGPKPWSVLTAPAPSQWPPRAILAPGLLRGANRDLWVPVTRRTRPG